MTDPMQTTHSGKRQRTGTHELFPPSAQLTYKHFPLEESRSETTTHQINMKELFILASISGIHFERIVYSGLHFRYPFFDSMSHRRAPNSQGGDNPKQMQTQAQNLLKSNLLAQTLVLAQQPHISVHLPLQAVKTEVYEAIPRKLSFSLSQKGLNHSMHSGKQWERGEYYPQDGRDHQNDDEFDR